MATKIQIYCSAVSITLEYQARLSGCGIILKVLDDEKIINTRELAFALGSSDLQLAQIQALRLALSSIKPGNRNYNSVTYVDNEMVIDILNKQYIIDRYAEVIEQLHKWFNSYKSMRIVVTNPNDPDSIRANEIATNAANKQVHYDSERKK